MSVACDKCGSRRVVSTNAKCSDLCDVRYPSGHAHVGYVPDDIGIGGGDYVEFSHCLACGKIQGAFPLEPAEHEEGGAAAAAGRVVRAILDDLTDRRGLRHAWDSIPVETRNVILDAWREIATSEIAKATEAEGES